jgi:hypothetical protein
MFDAASVDPLKSNTQALVRARPLACDRPALDESSFPLGDGLILNAHGWSVRAAVSDTDGIVLADRRLGPRYMAQSFGVPYFLVLTTASALDPGDPMFMQHVRGPIRL